LGCLCWVGLIILAVLGAAALSTGDTGPMLLGALFTLIVLSAIVSQLRGKREFLVIDEEGIRDDVAVPHGMLWRKVRRLELMKTTRGRSVEYSAVLHPSGAGLPRIIKLNFYKKSWQEGHDAIRAAWSRAVAQRPLEVAHADAAAEHPVDTPSGTGSTVPQPDVSRQTFAGTASLRRPPTPVEAHYSSGMAGIGLAVSLLLGGLLGAGGWAGGALHIALFGAAIGIIGGGIALHRLSDRSAKFATDPLGLLLPQRIRWEEIDQVAFETKTQQYGACRTFCYARLYLRNGREVRLDLNDLDRAAGELYERLVQGVEYGRQVRTEPH
jgi:hypothetical protein